MNAFEKMAPEPSPLGTATARGAVRAHAFPGCARSGMKRQAVLLLVGLALASGMLVSACRRSADADRLVLTSKGKTVDMSLAREGQSIFRNRQFGDAGIACADCHAEYEDRLQPAERILPGHSILGAARRQLAWNGAFKGDVFHRTAAGAAKCAMLYQNRGKTLDAALTAREADALMAFYSAISTGDEPSRLDWTAVTYPGDTTVSKETLARLLEPLAKLRPNAERGAVLYARACALCHAPGGIELGPSIRTQKKSLPDAPAIIRAGKGGMPFFSRDKLSDGDIVDIVAFIARNG
jgi:mono/diheme cytochrome c family protein